MLPWVEKAHLYEELCGAVVVEN